MNEEIVQDWVGSQLKGFANSEETIEYRIIRSSENFVQEVRSAEGRFIGAIELPDGIAMNKQSYEVMLRYALARLAA